MATGQTMLDLMEALDYGLQLQSGESGVTRGLKALNAAQDHLESMLALDPNVVGSTVGTITTSADTETTAAPTGYYVSIDCNISILRPVVPPGI